MAHEHDWSTAYNSIGVAHRDAAASRATRQQPVAGMTSFEAAYASAANDYPRFERQMIRTMHDEGITTGAKEPHPEMLRHMPNPKHGRPGSGRSMRSGRSVGSIRSQRSGASRRSAAASAAGSIVASVASSVGPPSGYYRQALPPPFVYSTSASQIGAGGHVPREPVPGREVWMLGRGGGQQSSFDSCLVHKGRYAAA